MENTTLANLESIFKNQTWCRKTFVVKGVSYTGWQFAMLAVKAETNDALAKLLSVGRDTVPKIIQKHFSMLKANTQLNNKFLLAIGYKKCSKCEKYYKISYFYKDASNTTGLSCACIYCVRYAKPKGGHNLREHWIEVATPKWADKNKIKEIYKNCPVGMSVDHIIPIQGEGVSGLHIPENLQYLPLHDNQVKGNRIPWTDKERNILRKYYYIVSKEELEKLLPNRTRAQCQRQVTNLKAKGWSFRENNT